MLDKKIKENKAKKVFWDEKTKAAYIKSKKALKDAIEA